MSVVLHDDDSILSIIYQETCNCSGRIVVEKVVKPDGKVRKVVVRMFACSFPWAVASDQGQGTPDVHASTP